MIHATRLPQPRPKSPRPTFFSSKIPNSTLAKPDRPPPTKNMTFRTHMDTALSQAKDAAARGEVPVGAVVVSPTGLVIAAAGNRTRELNDPTAHAEILAIRAACKELGQERLIGHDLYVTLEPCPMCAAAISNARIARLYYGAADPKSGGIAQGPAVFSHPQCHHAPEIYDGLSASASETLLKSFFASKRTG